MKEGKRILHYRKLLYTLLFMGVTALFFSIYVTVSSRVPSNIKIRVGMDQKLDFGIPASGVIYRDAIEVSGKNHSIPINLSQTVTLRGNEEEQYHMKLRVLGLIPLKEVNVEVIKDARVKPAGIPIGIYLRTEGVLVVGVGDFVGEEGYKQSPAKYVLQTGDYILEINEEIITEKKKLMSIISHSEGQELIFKVKRGEEIIYCKARPQPNQGGEYKMGIWVRDNAQGVGTMTYIDETGRFGALGHGINDVDTSTLMSLSSGTLYHAQIIGITKGYNGSPGELTGFIEYDDRNIMGQIENNTNKGIFGTCSLETISCATRDYLPIGLKQEIKEGNAQIICSLGDDVDYYDIEITKVNLDNENINRGIVLRITDKDLLETTGGIVQGMSGSPIIQNGKMIGAVTHVLVQDPTRGYGIFAETMLE